MEFVKPEEVVSRWTGGDAPDSSDSVLKTLVDDVNALSAYKFPDLEDRVTSQAIPARIVKMILSAVVQRAYSTSNNSLQNWSFMSGPFSESGTLGRDVDKAGKLFFTPEESTELSGVDLSGVLMLSLDPYPSRASINDRSSSEYL